MTLAVSLRGAARSLISKFGNTTTIYTYSTATKVENTEGDVSVSDWSNITATESFAGPFATCTVAHIPVTSWTSVQVSGVNRAYSAVLTTGVITPTVPLIGGETLSVVYKYANTVQTAYAVDGINAKEILTATNQSLESLGNDDKIFRDDAIIAINDRITSDSINYKVTEIRPVRTQDTLVIQIVSMIRVTDTTSW